MVAKIPRAFYSLKAAEDSTTAILIIMQELSRPRQLFIPGVLMLRSLVVLISQTRAAPPHLSPSWEAAPHLSKSSRDRSVRLLLFLPGRGWVETEKRAVASGLHQQGKPATSRMFCYISLKPTSQSGAAPQALMLTPSVSK